MWNKHLVAKLKEAGFQQSAHEECLFYFKSSVYVLYVDDSILTGPDPKELDEAIQALKSVGLDLTKEDGIDDFLGINIHKDDDGTLRLTQLQIIDKVLEDLRLLADNVAVKHCPASPTNLIRHFLEALKFDDHFHYRAIIGKLNFLENSTRPDIAYAVHMCARFSSDPRLPHGKAVKWIGRYLKKTRDKGLILRPDLSQEFTVYADADFAGNWNRIESADADTARSRTAYIIMYAGCPIYWQSTLQTVIALSTTEAEVISLSQALRATIPLMEIAREMKRCGHNVPAITPVVRCRLFEDNSAAIELASTDKIRPRTKYMGTKWHHFRDYVERGEIKILPIDTDDQPADMLSKPLPREPFEKHRDFIMGWWPRSPSERECEDIQGTEPKDSSPEPRDKPNKSYSDPNLDAMSNPELGSFGIFNGQGLRTPCLKAHPKYSKPNGHAVPQVPPRDNATVNRDHALTGDKKHLDKLAHEKTKSRAIGIISHPVPR